MLKRETLYLGDEEVCECERDAEAAPQEENLGSEAGVVFGGPEEVGVITPMICRMLVLVLPSGKLMLLTYAVPEPIRRSRETDTARADRDREDLSNDHPSHRTPSNREESNVEANESNHC